ncbi:HNH endonuclease signature motif containing protein [Agromyces laixinhei]|uniref:HNH endonuclease signature motif containing protein n=1 Tax=Agromyces laixinhei TaxID=2585717 RepID=UPI0012ECF8B5|nr:HNH endonuclease signature motif containing protein [Agromyces laixinhei]
MPEAAAALTELQSACAVVDDNWAGALPGGSTGSGSDVRVMSGDGLMRVTESLAELARRVQALQAKCAAELAARSRSGGDDDVAHRHGFSSPERLIATVTGGRYSDAAKLVAVGEATAARASFTGEQLPARHPHLAAGLEAGSLCVDAADTIRRFLDGVALRADRVELGEAERFLVERAPLVGVDGLARLVKQLQARLDPDGVKPREDELRSQRGLRIWEDRAGMIQLQGAFDPANGAPIKLAVEALVSAELHRVRDAKRGFGASVVGGQSGADGESEEVGEPEAAGEPDEIFVEQRTIAQLNADALADIARLSLGAKHAPAALRQATVVARIDAEALVTGHGHATIDGIDQPVSVATVRELAMSAGISPLLLDHRSEPLELGRAARLFTPAQKLALIERDGGCAWPACNRPPSHTQAHHIRWWKRHRGRTDVGNGIMLCSHHHHRVHDDGWVITVRDAQTWFTPPVHLDPRQRPRPGNRRLPSMRVGSVGVVARAAAA